MPANHKPDTDSPDAKSPIAKYHVQHLESSRTHRRPCIHFITFGRDYGPMQTVFPNTLRLDLSNHEPPDEHLCSRYTGLHPRIRKAFFDFPANEDAFSNALAALRRKMEEVMHGGGGGCVAFVINCTAGRHRSVAMAERLAEQVRLRDGFRAECLHLDLAKGADLEYLELARVEAAVGGMEEDVPRRGRVSERDRRKLREEARVSESEIRVRRVGEASPTRGWVSERGEGTAREKARVSGRDEGRGREGVRVSEDEIRVRHVRKASPTRGQGSERDEAKSARVSEKETRIWRFRHVSPTRGRSRERDEGRPREEARVSKMGEARPREEVRVSERYEGRLRHQREEARVHKVEELRRAKDQDQGVHSRRSEKKTVSWGTSVPVRESHRRRGEDGDESVGPARRDEERRT